jgi:uncharacterized protein
VVRIAALVVAIAAMAGCAGCTKAPEKPPGVSQTRDSSPPPPDAHAALTGPRVTLTGPNGAAEVRVEVVATDALIERGLMYRQTLAPDAGMLFVMGAERPWRFWMKNTLIPLDILFIKSDMTVAGILYDMKPLDEHSKGVDVPTAFVLEVNAGWSKAHGIAAGAKVAFLELDASGGPEGGFGADDE